MFIYKNKQNFNNIYEIITYEHTSGAKHFHVNDLVNTNTIEQSFIVAFETLPSSNNGVAHVLEHLILSGSQKYQGISPFFAMTRRSLANYMNALTYPDRTLFAYSTVEKNDFNNLLDFYLDSVFFPKLNELDFQQEAWHYSVGKNNKIEVEGVVYNEMQGVVIDRSYFVLQQIESILKPGTTYEYISGGDPLNIVDLKHKDVVDFYNQYYQPSKAIYMTFGNISIDEFHNKVQETIYDKLSASSENKRGSLLQVEDLLPKKKNIINPSNKSNKKNDYMYLLCWKLPEPSSQLVTDMNVLWKLLFSQGSSVANEVEKLEIGSLSIYNGIHNARNTSLVFGLDYLTEKEVSVIDKNLLSIIESITITQDMIEKTIDAIELDWSIPSGGMPGGIDFLMEYVVDMTMYTREFKNTFNIGEIRTRFTIDYVKNLITQLVHKIQKVEITGVPDTDFYKNRNLKQENHLDDLVNNLSEKDIENIQQNKIKIEKWIEDKDINTTLPIMDISKVSKTIKGIGNLSKISHALYHSDIHTNNLNYLNISFDLYLFKEQELQMLRLVCDLVESLSTKDMNWEQAMRYRRDLMKNFYIEISPYTDLKDKKSGQIMLEFSSIFLCKNINNVELFYKNLWNDVSFNDKNRIKILLENIIKDFETNMESNAFNLVDIKAKSELNFSEFINNKIEGLEYIEYVQNILVRLDDDFEALLDDCTYVWEKLLKQKHIITLAGNEGNLKEIEKLQDNLQLNKNVVFDYQISNIKVVDLGWTNGYTCVNQNVNYSYQMYDTINYANKDYVYLKLIAQIMTHYYLLPIVREKGGAYDCNAYYNALNGLFELTSHSDPNFEKTFKTFNNAFKWFNELNINEEMLLESKIVVLQETEKERTPDELITNSKFLKLLKFSDKDRQIVRDRILDATTKDLKEAFIKHLLNQEAKSFAVIKDSLENKAQQLGFKNKDLLSF